MIPSSDDLKKRKSNLDKLLKQIDPVTGKSREASMVSVVRSSIRKAWMRSPTKLAYLHMKTIPETDPSTRQKWKVACECCGEWCKLADVEVDHIEGNHSFKTVEDFQNYFEKILMVGFDGLQILCKNCHAVKSLSEKLGITFKEALTEKEVIAIIKAKKDKEWLSSRGITPATNAEKRRVQIRNELNKQE